MKIKTQLSIALLLLLAVQIAWPQDKIWDETEEAKKERLAWWREARFGMFIHWGQQDAVEGDINLLLPVNKPNVEIPVIELFLKQGALERG